MNVILPQMMDLKGGNLPVLYLLHGLSDDHTAWCRNTSIERYVEQKELAVVMPAANRSFYTDMKFGYPYGTFISEELPKIVRLFFHVSDRREDTFIAGLSMGGYGALKMALVHPGQYAAAASLSGAVDMAAVPGLDDSIELELIFKDKYKLAGSDDDLFYLARKTCELPVKPKIYQCCGTDDFLYAANIKFRDFMNGLSFDFIYEEEPGTHEWGYWDKKIQKVLAWLLAGRA
jgi:putative tributyrin esterase